MQTEPEIRTLTIDDYDALIMLWDRADLSYRPKGRDSRESMAREMVDYPHGFLGMFFDNRLIAFILASFDGRKGWINRLAVDPDFRGRGLGVRMIAEAERVLHEQFNAQIVTALVEPDNEPSRNLFLKCGYRVWEGMYYFSKRFHPDV
jgi:RimJ/RimL family protein N-acetyltransferase